MESKARVTSSAVVVGAVSVAALLSLPFVVAVVPDDTEGSGAAFVAWAVTDTDALVGATFAVVASGSIVVKAVALEASSTVANDRFQYASR